MGKQRSTPRMRVIRIILLVTSITIIVVSSIYWTKEFINHNRFPGPEVYYDRMYSASEKPCQVQLSEIFDFDFDVAYVIGNEIYADEDYFLTKLSVKTNIDIPELFSGQKKRIFFIKDNTIIYDYIYDLYYTQFLFADQEGAWIYPSTILTISQHKSADDQQSIIIISLVDEPS